MTARKQAIKDREALLTTLRLREHAHFQHSDNWRTTLIEPGPNLPMPSNDPISPDTPIQYREAEFQAMRWYRAGERGTRVEHCIIVKGRISAGEWHLLACVTHGVYAGELPDFETLAQFVGKELKEVWKS